MGCRILVGTEQGTDTEAAAFFCSTSGVVFGPLMNDEDEAEAFLSYLGAKGHADPRRIAADVLIDFYADFVKQSVQS